jgi:hypothetical protein
MDEMQIAKLVMQIHANYVLIIDSKKNQIFLMGGVGVTHVILVIFAPYLANNKNLVKIKSHHILMGPSEYFGCAVLRLDSY